MSEDAYTLTLTRDELDTLQDAIAYHYLEACRAFGAAKSAGRPTPVAQRWMEDAQNLGRKVDSLIADAGN